MRTTRWLICLRYPTCQPVPPAPSLSLGKVITLKPNVYPTAFKCRALTALSISVVADLLDFVAAPIFAVPVIGDMFDALTIALLYSITKSKFSTAINTIEFVPLIGDLLPVYTFSTMIWIFREAISMRIRKIRPRLRWNPSRSSSIRIMNLEDQDKKQLAT